MKQKIQQIFDTLREFIVSHDYQTTPVLTVYANVDSTNPDNRRDRPEWLIELKNETKRLEEKHGSEALELHKKRHEWADAEATILAHLTESKPQGRSIVLFTDLEDYLTVDVPVTLPNKLYFGVPQVRHLLFALDCYKKYLVVLFSEEVGKVFEVFLTSTTADAVVELGKEGGVSLRPGGRTARTQASERRDLDSERRVVAEAAEQINAYFMGDTEIERIVFGGNLKLAHAVKNQLHPSVADMLVSIEPIDINSTNNEVAAAVKRIADEQEQEHDLALMNDLVSRRHACGTAVLETQGVQLALENGQAQKLVIAMPIESDKFDPLLTEAVLNNVEIEFVHAAAAEQLNSFGGVAAKLYYSGK